MDNLYTKAQIKEKAEGEFTAIASSEIEDRQGEIVRQTGWNLKNFKNNPVLLYMHDHTKPIGKATRVWLDKSGASPMLKFKGFISDATEELKGYRKLVEDGILNSFSVGFRPLEMDGNEITKAELFEISLVSVPANPEARLLAVKSLEDGGFKSEVINKIVGDEDDIKSLKAELEEAKKLAREALEQANIAVKGLQYLAPQRSKQEIVSKRLQSAKLLARVSDKLIVESKSPKTVDHAKLIKRTSEKLISELKGDL
ncbi:MAG TPA: HK97 family phage prohead protease [bacterium]|nr:HK97 family phage prohead protease [bacterium]